MASLLHNDTRVLECVDGPCRGTLVKTDAPEGVVLQVTQYVKETGPDRWGWYPYDVIDYRVEGDALVQAGG